MIWRRQPLRPLLRTLVPELRVHRRPLATAYACRTMAVAAAVVAPWPVKVLIDHVATGTSAALRPELLVVGLAGAFLALTLTAVAAGAAEKNLSATVRERMTLELRDRAIAHLLTLSPTFRARHRSGELVLRVVDDTDLFARVLTKTVPQVFQHAATIVGTLIVMWWVDPLAALIGCAWLPVIGLVLRADGRRLWAASREKRAREGEVSALAQEIARGMSVIQASGQEAATREAFQHINEPRVRAGRRETAVAVSMERTLQMTQGLALALVTGVGAWFVLRGRLSVGDLTVLTVYVGQLLKPIEKLNDLAETTGRGLAGADRLLWLFRQSPSVVDAPGALALQRCSGVIEVENVSFGYPDRDRPILSGVTLRLAPASLTVLVGKSGAGKSTLLALLVRLMDPDSGQVRLDGRPLCALQLRSLRNQFAVLSQDAHLFSGTLRQVLAPAGRFAPDGDLWDALAAVSLDRFVRELPRQLETALGEDGINLSGGQRRRLALARVFLLRRPVLLLDEPLANIDSESAAIVLEAILRFRKVCTCFAVTHESGLLRHADRVIRLENGRLTELSTRTGSTPSLAVVR